MVTTLCGKFKNFTSRRVVTGRARHGFRGDVYRFPVAGTHAPGFASTLVLVVAEVRDFRSTGVEDVIYPGLFGKVGDGLGNFSVGVGECLKC